MSEISDDYTVCAGDHLELGHFHRSIERVDDWLIVQSGAILDAPALTRVGGRLMIEKGAQVHVPHLAAVGDLQIAAAEVIFPKLARICGFLEAEPGAVVDAPALTRVERLYVGSGAVVRAPSLATSGQTLRIAEGGVLVAPRGVCAQPGDTWSRLWRRVRVAAATRPHGRCVNSVQCVEHARDNAVQSCKRRGRFSKKS